MALSTNSMMSLVFTLVAIAISISIASMIITDVQGTANSTTDYLYNTTDAGLSAFDTFSDFLPTLAIVVVAVVIIGLIAYFRT